MVQVKIDGKDIDVPAGTTVLVAARQLGIDIPTFCYHDGLTRPANCRMCLVNTNKAPKLVPACYQTVMDGMEVTTRDEKTVKTRKSVLEFILLNHPVDCPICDQAGECVLQDNYFAHSASPSRLFTKKVHKQKALKIGPNVFLDAERCVECTRCVRFCTEVTKTGELQIVNRGERSEISTYPGRQLDNDYATNVVDLCPVGALTAADFRFKVRVWFLKSVDSVCGGCSRGCNIVIDHHENHVQRYRPRYNADVNQWWMCDPGRLSYGELEAARLTHARSAGGSELGLKDALGIATRKLLAFKDAHGFASLALVPSLASTNEDLYALLELAETLGAGSWYAGGRAPGKEDDLLQRADKNPNRKGLETLLGWKGKAAAPLSQLAADIASGKIKGVLWMGHDHAPDAAVQAALGKVQLRIAIASNDGAWLEGADPVLPMRTFAEVDGTWTNVQGKAQRLHRALDPKRDVLPLWELAYRLGRGLGHMDTLQTPASAKALFTEMAAQVPALSGLDFGGVPGPGKSIPAAA